MTKPQHNTSDIEKWLRLVRAEGLGPVTFSKIIKGFGSVDRALGASVSELSKINGIGYKKAERIAATRDKFDVSAEIEKAENLGIWIITFIAPSVLKVLIGSITVFLPYRSL